MYTMYCDGVGFYSPQMADGEYSVVSPKITQELNKAGSLTFILPPDNVVYSSIKKLKSIVTVEKDGEEIFRGRVLHDNKDFYNRKTIYCEGELSYLLDSVVRPYEFSGSVAELFQKYIQEHNAQVEAEKQFTIGQVDLSDMDVEEQYETYVFVPLAEEPADWGTNFGNYYFLDGGIYYQIAITTAPEFAAGVYYRKDTEALTRMTQTEAESSDYPNTLDEINSKLIDEFGGYLRIRYEGGMRYLDYLSSFGQNSGQIIACGENLLDLSEYITAENLFTCLIPLGGGEDGEPLTIASVNDGLDYISNQTAVDLFGRIWATNTWDNISNAEKLKQKAEEYLENNISMSVQLTAKAVDLNLVDVDTERLRLGDSVRVVSTPHNLDTWFLCSRVTLDLVSAGKSEYTFGYAFGALTDQQIDEKKALNRKIAMSKIIGNRALAAAKDAQTAASNARSYAAGAATELEKDLTHAEASLAAQIEVASAAIALKANQTEVEGLEDKVISLEEAQADLVVWARTAEASLELKASKETVEQQGDQISAIEQAQAALTTRVRDAENTLTMKAEQSTVTDLEGRVSDVESAQTTLSSRVGNAEASLELKAEQSTVTDLEGRVTTAETAVATLQANEVDIKADIIDLQGRVDVTGAVTVSDGALTVERAIIGNKNIRANGGLSATGLALDTEDFTMAGKSFAPEEITSTAGTVTVLGC